MSLTTGTGPLSPNPAGTFSEPVPSGVVYVEPYPRRIRAVVGDQTVIDTERAHLVHRPGQPTSYAFPVADVPSHFAEPEPAVPGHVAVAWGRVDAWYEEDVHLAFQSYPKNPYHRIDCLPTKRRLRVEVDGVSLADTIRTIVLYETALAPRLYVSKDDVRMELLSVNPTTTSWCSYKGHATWWDATMADVTVANVAWSYEDPLPESVSIGGMLSFDESVVNVSADLPPGRS